ncbi:MAG TPA: CDP-alcohol phosphatidyltransferase family protein [Rhodoblastus sp.]|nr:CDP-alcohol phosphatidyltransferase family protein [Rhodoblastus sp.]
MVVLTINGDQPVRRNRSFLAEGEQKLIRWILPRIPANVTSLHLTAIGMAGSVVTAIALVGCNWSSDFLPVVIFGVLLNWFGDSLDGSLARYRHTERPRFGFLVDHTCDLFSQILIIVAFALSPFLTLVSALVILLCYLLYSAYTYIRAAVHRVHQMSYIGVGATEFRILMIVWACIGEAFDLDEGLAGPLTNIDIAIVSMGAMAVVGLGFKAWRDAREVALSEPPVEVRAAAPESSGKRARNA